MALAVSVARADRAVVATVWVEVVEAPVATVATVVAVLWVVAAVPEMVGKRIVGDVQRHLLRHMWRRPRQ